MTTSVSESVNRLSESPASTSADRVKSSAACTPATIAEPTLPLAPKTPTRMSFTLDRAGSSTVGCLSTTDAFSMAGAGIH